MSSNEGGDKTEPATLRRRLELRRQGRVARSGDLTTAAAVLAATAALHIFGADLAGALAQLLRKSLEAPFGANLDPAVLTRDLTELGQAAARGTLPILALLFLAAVAVNLLQVGFLATTEPLTPDLGRLNPFAGLRRIWSGQGPVSAGASAIRLSVLVAILAGFIVGQLPLLIRVGELDPAGSARVVGSSIVRLGYQMAAGLIILAVADYAFQVWRFERQIRMTKEELRDELRQTEGDPQMRQRRREAHRKLSDAERPLTAPRRHG